MKQLTAIAVSTITYLKNIFPVECYTSFELEEMTLQVLNEDSNDEDALNTCVALKNAFIALEKKFLHKLVLCLYNGAIHMDNLVETYTFEYSYKNSVSVAVCTGAGATHEARYSADHIYERTLHIFKACVVTSREGPAGGLDYNIGLRLYHNQDTPEEYQTPGYRREEPDEDNLQEYEQFSSVSTPFHRVSASLGLRNNHASCSVNVSSETDVPSFNEEDLEIIEKLPEATKVKCACSKEDNSEPMLTCKFCGTLQHAACYGFASSSPTFAEHCCACCSDEEPSRSPTCSKLAATTARKRTALCMFRRTVRWLRSERPRRLLPASLAARFPLSLSEETTLTKALLRINILGHDDVQLINYDEVEKAIKNFFRKEENTVVDRLFAESLSQSEAPDPVSQMLHPSEKISLQQASNMGQIVQHTPPDSAQEDPTLKQYRDAIFSAEDTTNDEFPLSGTHNPIQNIGETKASKRKQEESENDEKRPLKSQQVNKKLCLKRKDRKT